MDIEKFHQQVVGYLNEIKRYYAQNPEYYRILVKNAGNNVVAYIRSISDETAADKNLIKLLVRWREENWQAYPTVFKVTLEGTKKWLQSQLLEREDRILFLIITLSGEPVGHLGLSNFNFVQREAEIDNVVRGVKTALPGIMTFALAAMDEWAFKKLGLKRLFLRVFLDNERAIRLYEHCGFKGVKKIPLHKVIEGENFKYEEIPEGENLSVDRVFYLMELLNKK